MVSTMRPTAAVLSVMFLAACGSPDEQVSSAGGDGSVEEIQAPAGGTHECPDPGPVPPLDQDPNPRVEVVVLSGDFGDEPWCLSISESDDIGPCIGIRSGAAPEGQQLSSGACDGDLSRLNWHVTGDPEHGFVVYGHAPANATQVRLFAAGLDPMDVETDSAPEVSDATFFAARLPHGFFPDQGAAYDGDQEIERIEAPVGTAGD
jgi:hypothetical protein